MHNFTRAAVAAMLLICTILSASADLKKFMLTGYIYDRQWNNVDSCEVELFKDDTVKVDFKLLTGIDGTNKLKSNQLRALVNSGLGEYRITIYKDGYSLYSSHFRIGSVSENQKYLRTITLDKDMHRNLDEVTVTGTRIKMVMKGDTVVYDAAAFQLSKGSMLDALVRQLPGATISQDGVIEVNGRKMNELLINGKDFFKGDPKVALQNLPAYTVKDIKVYDKADDDAYLTHSDANADKLEGDKNLVMDVRLKKEYLKGRLANIEAGYGTDDRYMGRVFGLGYTDKLRVSVFGNLNNVGNTSQAGDQGQWWERSSENGINRVNMGGMDYSYKNGEETELSGSVTVNQSTNHEHELSSVTRFYSTGDLYRRGEMLAKNKNFSLRTNHRLRFRAKAVSFSILPSVDWNRNKNRREDLTATFEKDVAESYRGQAIDSVFSSRSTDNEYRRDLLTSLQQLTGAEGDNFHGRLTMNTTIRPATWKGILNVQTIGDIQNNSDEKRTLFNQEIGPASTDTSDPVKRDNYNETSLRRRAGQVGATYSRDYTDFGETRTKRFSWALGGNYDYTYNNNDIDAYSADRLPSPLTPPSVNRPDYLLADMANSPYTRHSNSSPRVNASVNWSSQPTAPGDSTLNAGYGVYLSASYRHYIEHYDFEKPGITEQHLKRNNDWLLPNASFFWNSQNKVRSMQFSVQYSLWREAPDFRYLVDNRDTSDPMNIVLGNPDGLRNSLEHRVYVNFGRFGRGRKRQTIYVYGQWQVATNTVAMAQTYNPATGVTVTRPENISGNWNASLNGQYFAEFNDRLSMQSFLGVSGTNSADYVAVDATPQRSSVFSTRISPSARLQYKFKNGSMIGAGLTVTALNQHSEREGFNDRTSYEYSPRIQVMLKLPAQIELNSNFNPYFRRGNQNKEMNTNEYVWNATAVKTFANSGLSLKLAAYDILKSAKHVYSTVNAQGRTETWRNCLPRYVMLSAIYRIDMKKK